MWLSVSKAHLSVLTGNWDLPTPTGMTPQGLKLSKLSVLISFSIMNSAEISEERCYIKHAWEFNICL